ncbi:MAG: hypothetical protein P8173_06230 [Gammaproteobacteria bacterium]
MNRIILTFSVATLASGSLHGVILGNLSAVAFASVFAIPFFVVFGLPAYLLLKRQAWVDLWQTIVAGICLGAMFGLIVSISFGLDRYSVSSLVGSLGLFPLHGGFVAAIFWILALKDRSSNKAISPGV